jgi:uncharacterized protein (DUF2336 family)
MDVLQYIAAHGGIPVAAEAATWSDTDRPALDDDVRAELARKIARLMPDLSHDGVVEVRALAIETLEKLAMDQAPRVRAILAEEIKHLDCVPKSVVDRLARDVEEFVAAPVLEYSPLLSDIDLLEIIASAKAQHVLTAVAKRRYLCGDVCDAIAASLDITAVAAMLTNPNAKIREQTLERLVEAAEDVAAWHEPLVLRVDLSLRLVRRLATFVGFNLLDHLTARSGLDDETRRVLNRRLHDRLLTGRDSEGTVSRPVDQVPDALKNSLSAMGQQLEVIAKAGDRDAVALALVSLTKLPLDTVARIIDSRCAKAITSLVWLARLPMRAAFQIQCHIMKLAPKEILPARNGRDFPLTEKEMLWQLGLFGLTPRTPKQAEDIGPCHRDDLQTGTLPPAE